MEAAIDGGARTLTDALLGMVGPGRFLHSNCRDTTLVSALLRSGCDAWGWPATGAVLPDMDGRIAPAPLADGPESFDCVLLSIASDCEPAWLLNKAKQLRKYVRRSLVLLPLIGEPPQGGGNSRSFQSTTAIEDIVIQAGYRRHPAAFPLARYARLNDPRPESLIGFEIIDDGILARWPLEKLLADRDLHMDMSRESGARADAHLVRYALAAEYARPSDIVLDCACGLGYGSALLAAASRADRVIGVDIDSGCIAYATDNFGSPSIQFECASATDLSCISDCSIDLAVGFETIEHLDDYESFIREIARVLKPDGRFIASVPHLWVDETGHDPNPHHQHAFDFPKLRDALTRHFLIEARFAQTAPGGVKLQDALRRIDVRPLEPGNGEDDAEWWIVVAAAKPEGREKVPYHHPAFDPLVDGTDVHLTAFGRYYDNPWIYRQFIQNGERIRDAAVLADAIGACIERTGWSSADRGALLTVQSYAALASGDPRLAVGLFADIATYQQQRSDNPHVWRWQISLAYAAGLLSLSIGRREQGRRFLETASQMDPFRFSPLLATKTVAAHFHLGVMQLVDGDAQAASRHFLAGSEMARAALRADPLNAIGNPESPLPFGFFELAEIADMGGQCATALASVHKFGAAPGMLWRLVDTKRFGLMTWLQGLSAELNRLQADNLALAKRFEAECSLRVMLPKRIREVICEILPAMVRRTIR